MKDKEKKQLKNHEVYTLINKQIINLLKKTLNKKPKHVAFVVSAYAMHNIIDEIMLKCVEVENEMDNDELLLVLEIRNHTLEMKKKLIPLVAKICDSAFQEHMEEYSDE